jgi:hypothetical protein
MSYIIQFKPNVTPKLYNNYLNVYKEVDITDENVVKQMTYPFKPLALEVNERETYKWGPYEGEYFHLYIDSSYVVVKKNE